MAEKPQQIGPIAVYGATGYTGRLVAAELRRRGVDLILAGRNMAKLEIVAEDLGAGVAVREAKLDDRDALHELLEPCGAVIACAGPFREHGEPVLAAAVEARTHYLDTTGEQPFIRMVFEDYGGRAERAGIALVTAMGFDYAPGDMIAALTAEGMGPLDELILAYATIGFGPTRGTALSALGMLSGGDVEWRDGELVPASQSVPRGTWDFPEPVGRQRMVRYPAGEHITVPRHVETRTVRTMLSAAAVVPFARLSRLAPIAMLPLQVATRTPLRRGMQALVSRLPEGPSEDARRRARFMVVCEARQGERRRRGTVSGSDPYGLTARAAVEGALQCASPAYDRSGALAQSEAFDAREFLRSLHGFGVEHEVVPV
jgi:short subunit dehydrogenase-like uncharacterized protein